MCRECDNVCRNRQLWENCWLLRNSETRKIYKSHPTSWTQQLDTFYCTFVRWRLIALVITVIIQKYIYLLARLLQNFCWKLQHRVDPYGAPPGLLYIWDVKTRLDCRHAVLAVWPLFHILCIYIFSVLVSCETSLVALNYEQIWVLFALTFHYFYLRFYIIITAF